MSLLKNLLLCLFLVLCMKEALSSPRKLVFDSFFKWQTASFSLTKEGATGSNEFTAEINSNEKGIYLRLRNEKSKGGADFLSDISYQEIRDHEVVSVFDYALMDCDFKDKSSWLETKLEFKIRTFNQQNKTNSTYVIQFKYKFGSGFLGGVSAEVIASNLKEKCLDRQQTLADQLASEAIEKEKKRIEAEKAKELEIQKNKQISKDLKEEEERIKKEEESKNKTKTEEEKIEDQKNKEEAENSIKTFDENLKKLEKEAAERAQKEKEKTNEADLVEHKDDKISKDEKKFFENWQEIRVHFDTGFGRAVYITGDSESLGQWKNATRLQPIKHDLWVWRTKDAKNGTVFKTLVAYWDEGKHMDIDFVAGQKRPIYWENPAGEAGNKKIIFDEDYVMNHHPTFEHF